MDEREHTISPMSRLFALFGPSFRKKRSVRVIMWCSHGSTLPFVDFRRSAFLCLVERFRWLPPSYHPIRKTCKLHFVYLGRSSIVFLDFCRFRLRFLARPSTRNDNTSLEPRSVLPNFVGEYADDNLKHVRHHLCGTSLLEWKGGSGFCRASLDLSAEARRPI